MKKARKRYTAEDEVAPVSFEPNQDGLDGRFAQALRSCEKSARVCAATCRAAILGREAAFQPPLSPLSRMPNRDLRQRHDVTEALTLATRIAVLGNGKLECIVSPQEFVKARTPVARSFLDTLPEAALTRGAAI